MVIFVKKSKEHMSKGVSLKTFLISVLGTAIGVALTFSLNELRSEKQKDQAQRMTAIMVIHDIDNTIDALKELKESEQLFNDYAQFILDHKDCMETVPLDTLSRFANMLSKSDVNFRFDTAKEKMFNSSIDAWHSLGDVKFMDNVQSFYFERQQFQELLDNSESFREPLAENIDYMLFAKYGMMSGEEYAHKLCAILKEKFKDNAVMVFITLSSQRKQTFISYIDHWSQLNDENKFLIGITDKEMEDFINSMNENGKPLNKKQLVGTWAFSLEDDNESEYVFKKDGRFKRTDNMSQIWYAQYWSGTFKSSYSISGTWDIQGDSLVFNNDPASILLDLDVSEMIPVKGKEDSLSRWAAKYKEEVVAAQVAHMESDSHDAFKSRLDPSCDKMEWTRKDGKVFYIKRK